MRKILSILTIALIMISCGPEDKKLIGESNTGKILKGEHQLRRFNVKTEKGTSWSASYFLIAGSAGGHSYQDTKVSFSWQLSSGEYAISELPLEKIRVKIDSTVKTPYVTFHWDPSGHDESELYMIMTYNVNYMVVHCKEEDYPVNININQL